MNLWAIFLTGLTTGGLSCLAMQGGLLAGIVANQKEEELNPTGIPSSQTTQSFDVLDWLPVTLFLGAKLISHTLLGFLLGWLGSRIELGIGARLTFQALAAFFMFATAANLLNLHPVFRYVVFQPPKFLQKLVRGSTKSKALFTPAVLGFLTIFIPCGVTQAMEILAISYGSPLMGAAIMFFFVLGTSPLFAILGVATARLSEVYTNTFQRIAAGTLILLALSSLHGILVVLDSPLTLGKVTKPVTEALWGAPATSPGTALMSSEGVQHVTIEIKNSGYVPNRVQVKAGVPVRLTLQTNETYSCASAFLLKSFNIKLQLGPTDKKTVSFTPTKKGKYPFSCSMGMYSGVLEVL